MPYINVRILDDGVTTTQKRSIIRGVTQVVVDVLEKRPDAVHVVIDEVPLQNWGLGGESVSDRRAGRGES